MSEIALGFQMAQTRREANRAAEWEQYAAQWRTHAEQLQAKLDATVLEANKAIVGCDAVIIALKQELNVKAPESPLNDADRRKLIRFNAINDYLRRENKPPITIESLYPPT